MNLLLATETFGKQHITPGVKKIPQPNSRKWVLVVSFLHLVWKKSWSKCRWISLNSTGFYLCNVQDKTHDELSGIAVSVGCCRKVVSLWNRLVFLKYATNAFPFLCNCICYSFCSWTVTWRMQHRFKWLQRLCCMWYLPEMFPKTV